MIASNAIRDIHDSLQPVFEKYRDEAVFAYVFGSASRGDADPHSDVDIAVFLSETIRKTPFELKLSLYADFCRALKRNDIDVVVLNTVNNLVLLDEIIRYGTVIYDADSEMREGFELKAMHEAIDFKQQRLAVMGV